MGPKICFDDSKRRFGPIPVICDARRRLSPANRAFDQAPIPILRPRHSAIALTANFSKDEGNK
jgi:hypothetical protein